MMIREYKEMTRREKEQFARRVVMATGAMTVGILLGVSFRRNKYVKEIECLEDNMECLESDNFELEVVIDRQTKRLSELIKENEEQDEQVERLLGEITVRDLSIMEHFDGDSIKYRGLRSNIFEQDELVKIADRLDNEAEIAEDNYRAFKHINNKK